MWRSSVTRTGSSKWRQRELFGRRGLSGLGRTTVRSASRPPDVESGNGKEKGEEAGDEHHDFPENPQRRTIVQRVLEVHEFFGHSLIARVIDITDGSGGLIERDQYLGLRRVPKPRGLQKDDDGPSCLLGHLHGDSARIGHSPDGGGDRHIGIERTWRTREPALGSPEPRPDRRTTWTAWAMAFGKHK